MHREPINRSWRQTTVSIDNDDNVRRIFVDVPQAPVEGITLANPRGIIALGYLGPRFNRDLSSIVAAIVGNDDKPVAGL